MTGLREGSGNAVGESSRGFRVYSDPMNLTFRPAAFEDADAVVLLANSAYRGESSKKGWTTEADILGGQRTDAGKIREMVGAEKSRIELGFDGEKLVACVHLKIEADGACYLGMLCVDPLRQAAGLGKLLMTHCEELARAWKCPRMRMTVIDCRTELIAYYERRGYARTGKIEPFPATDPRFGLPKVSGLRFAELSKPLSARP